MRKGNPKGPWRVEGVLVVKTLPQGWPSLTGLAVIVPVPLPQALSTPMSLVYTTSSYPVYPKG